MTRFNASRVLELLKGKRMVFVGDSIGRNQWESMLCMLASGVHDEVGKQRIHEVNGEPITKHKGFLSFRFPDHDNLTVEYYRSPYLVPQGTPPPNSPTNVSCTIFEGAVSASVHHSCGYHGLDLTQVDWCWLPHLQLWSLVDLFKDNAYVCIVFSLLKLLFIFFLLLI